MTPCQRHFYNELGGLEPAHTLIFKATALVGSAPSVVFLHPEKALPGSSAQPVCFHGEGRLSGTPSPAGRSGPGGGSSRKPPGLPEVKEAAPVVDSGLLNGDSQLYKLAVITVSQGSCSQLLNCIPITWRAA